MIMDLVNIIVYFFRQLGMFGVFLSMFVENIGIPIPTEFGYLIAQDIVNRAVYNYFWVISVLTLGHVAGSVVSYEIGRLGDSFVKRKIKSSNKIHEVHKILTHWYLNYGTVTVFITRFVGYIRPWSSFVAGFANVPFLPFLAWTALGSLIFNIIALYLSNIFMLIWRNYSNLHLLIILIAGFFFFASIIYWGLRNLHKIIIKKRS